MGFPSDSSGKKSACQCKRNKRRGLDPWVRKIPWRRAWQPTPVFLPREFHGERSLAGYSLWGRKDSDMTERTWHAVRVIKGNWFNAISNLMKFINHRKESYCSKFGFAFLFFSLSLSFFFSFDQ